MRDGRDVFDGGDFEADRLEGADGGFAAGAGAFDAHFDLLHAVRHRLAGGIPGDLLGSVSGALARTFETDASGGGPADHMTLHVCDADESVVEGRKNVCDAHRNTFRKANKPTGTMVYVPRLALPGAMVEISAVAIIGR